MQLVVLPCLLAAAYVLTPPPPAASSRHAAPVMKDFPKPPQLANTDPYREATALSQKLSSGAWRGNKKKVAISASSTALERRAAHALAASRQRFCRQ